MLYEVTAQPTVFLWMMLTGFACGFLFDLKNILLFFAKRKVILSHFLMFFAIFLTFFAFFYVNLQKNYGEFRLFAVLAFLLSIAIQRFFAVNFLAKPLAKCYHIIKGKIDDKLAKRKQKEKREET